MYVQISTSNFENNSHFSEVHCGRAVRFGQLTNTGHVRSKVTVNFWIDHQRDILGTRLDFMIQENHENNEIQPGPAVPDVGSRTNLDLGVADVRS